MEYRCPPETFSNRTCAVSPATRKLFTRELALYGVPSDKCNVKNKNMFIFKTKINYKRLKSDIIVYIYMYYQLTIMKRELVSQNVYKAHFNDMKYYACNRATTCSTY